MLHFYPLHKSLPTGGSQTIPGGCEVLGLWGGVTFASIFLSILMIKNTSCSNVTVFLYARKWVANWKRLGNTTVHHLHYQFATTGWCRVRFNITVRKQHFTETFSVLQPSQLWLQPETLTKNIFFFCHVSLLVIVRGRDVEQCTELAYDLNPHLFLLEGGIFKFLSTNDRLYIYWVWGLNFICKVLRNILIYDMKTFVNEQVYKI